MLRGNQTAPTTYHQKHYSKSMQDHIHFQLFSNLLSHYDFRVNNRLMVEKIINPRRDKIIMGSLVNASTKCSLRKKKSMPSVQIQTDDRRNVGDQKCSNLSEMTTTFKIRKNKMATSEGSSSYCYSAEKSTKSFCLNEDKQIMSHSKFFQIRESSLRNNFIGRIMKNTGRIETVQTNRQQGYTMENNLIDQRVEGQAQSNICMKKDSLLTKQSEKQQEVKKIYKRASLNLQNRMHRNAKRTPKVKKEG